MKLTRRQGEIAELAALGLANKTIARQLGITEGTVKLHMQENLARLGNPFAHGACRAMATGYRRCGRGPSRVRSPPLQKCHRRRSPPHDVMRPEPAVRYQGNL